MNNPQRAKAIWKEAICAKQYRNERVISKNRFNYPKN
jgi:hypothetical protein